jgi:hypothetical protein
MDSWLVELRQGDDPLFTFKNNGLKLPPGAYPLEALSPEERTKLLAFPMVLNPWEMRENFFKIKDPSDALAFFRKYGVWRFSRYESDSPSNMFPHEWARGRDEDEPFPIRFSELIYQRNYFEDALNSKPDDWLKRASINTGDIRHDAPVIWEAMYLYGPSSGDLDMSIVNLQGSRFPGPFKGSITCYEIQDALRATVLLDWMEGREWPRCKACRRVFKRTSKHPQFYCCAACASRARQATFRKNRANQTEGEA